MAGKTACMFIHASLMIITILLTSSTAAIADDTIPIPSDSSQVASWFDNNVKTYNERKSTLDPALVAAEHAPQVVICQGHARWRWKLQDRHRRHQ
ncbi:hypothetical protein ACFX2I_001698 [Malus domestica]